MLPSLIIPEEYKQQLKIGTCSWKYDSWKDLVYHPDKRYEPYDYLWDYAKYFNTVEIDQWFWSLFTKGIKLPDRETAKAYAESVPDEFVFSVKVPNSITLTHYYAKGPTGYTGEPNPHFLDVKLFNEFLENLEPMHNKLGPAMLQFEYLNKSKMPTKKAFMEKLDKFFAQAPQGFQYAIETRNPNYLTEEFFDFLRNHKLGFVLLDGYYMPPISDVTNEFDIRTTDFIVIRLHGPDRAKIEKQTGENWNSIVDPHDSALTDTVELIRTNTKAKATTYVNVNNHYEGSAPLTIERLLKQMRS